MKRSLSNKEVVLGVTGSIAAYKACELASRLVEAGVVVIPALTRSALEFVGAVSFEAITGRHAVTGMFEPVSNPDIEHIALASRASLFLIAPATANILAKAAHGIADDWLSTTLLATRAPILFAPAMNSNMYAHPATQANIELLRTRGCHFVGPDVGRLACKTVGPGRLIDPGIILDAAFPLIAGGKELAGKRVLITSGPNHEPIDPVRYIANRSSGKMGRVLALEALARGAQVTFVTGPAPVPPPCGVEVVRVETAREMAHAVEQHLPACDVFISAAAVADYRVENAGTKKHKRGRGPLTLNLVENPDIVAGAAQSKRPGQVVVGFAAETQDLIANAQAKITAKGLDLIVANQVGTADSGFGVDFVRAAIIDRQGQVEDLDRVDKDELAERLFDRIGDLLM